MMKKFIFFFLLFPIAVNAQSFLQVGPSVNYGFTTLKSSQVGSGASFTYLYKYNSVFSVYGDASVSLHGGKTSNYDGCSYGAWNTKFSVGVDFSIYYTENATPLYGILGVGYSMTNAVFVTLPDNNLLVSKYDSTYPGIDIGIGTRIPWGNYNSMVLELKYTQVYSDYYDGVKEIGNYHNDSYLTFTFKTELPL